MALMTPLAGGVPVDLQRGAYCMRCRRLLHATSVEAREHEGHELLDVDFVSAGASLG